MFLQVLSDQGENSSTEKLSNYTGFAHGMPNFPPWKEEVCHTRMGKKMYGSTLAFRLNGENQDYPHQRHIEKNAESQDHPYQHHIEENGENQDHPYQRHIE